MSGVEFVCTSAGCRYKTSSIDLAERHEKRTGHDVWEVPS